MLKRGGVDDLGQGRTRNGEPLWLGRSGRVGSGRGVPEHVPMSCSLFTYGSFTSPWVVFTLSFTFRLSLVLLCDSVSEGKVALAFAFAWWSRDGGSPLMTRRGGRRGPCRRAATGGGLFGKIGSRASGQYFMAGLGGGTPNVVLDAEAGVRGVGWQTENKGPKVKRIKVKGSARIGPNRHCSIDGGPLVTESTEHIANAVLLG